MANDAASITTLPPASSIAASTVPLYEYPGGTDVHARLHIFGHVDSASNPIAGGDVDSLDRDGGFTSTPWSTMTGWPIIAAIRKDASFGSGVAPLSFEATWLPCLTGWNFLPQHVFSRFAWRWRKFLHQAFARVNSYDATQVAVVGDATLVEPGARSLAVSTRHCR